MAQYIYVPQRLRAGIKSEWRDIVLFVAFFALLFGTLHLMNGMRAPFSTSKPIYINLSPSALPGYAARSVLRMFIAFAASILFTLVYGYIAAYNARAEKFMVPLLDILQSVPVLGFLSVTVFWFMSLFPGSIMGLECASIFAIFTGQAWNMTFSFYHSLKMIPRELREASTVYQLSWWQRFIKLEVPFSMIGLVWNGMMSFGGGWFFLAASEAISVLNSNFELPGIGSYMAEAVLQSNARAVCYAIAAMILIVVLIDQLFWRPVVAWSQRFKFETTDTGMEPSSWLFDLLRYSTLMSKINEKLFVPLNKRIDRLFLRAERVGTGRAWLTNLRTGLGWIALVALCIGVLCGVYLALLQVGKGLTLDELLYVIKLGIFTLARVAVMVVIATIVWTPIGVRIGSSPRLASIAQPLVQIGASFPANLIFPVAVIAFIRFNINLNWGSIILLALGTQYYILFNVIAGAMAIPGDLREAALVFRMRGWTLWRKLIIPAIFPAWVTGALTASGGAWNASIVAEVASWGSHKLRAQGLGAYIADATEKGNWPHIILGIAVMSALVVLLNRVLWRQLYQLASDKYTLG